MPDEESKPGQTQEGVEAPSEPKPKKSLASLGIFGGVMVVEGLAIFLCMKFFGADPDPTVGMTNPLQTTTAPFEESKEYELAHVRVQNANGPRTTLYSVKITIRVLHEHDTLINEFLENRKATIHDVVSRIIRSTDERHLSEPGLETLKRLVRHEVTMLLGGDDTIIEQVLIPEFTPLPTGF